MRNDVKLSVIMVDGSFRENFTILKHLDLQTFPESSCEAFWIEYYDSIPDEVANSSIITPVALDNPRNSIYRAAICFNEGIRRAAGDIIVIPDADVTVSPSFLQTILHEHQKNPELVMYFHRFDQPRPTSGTPKPKTLDELKKACRLADPVNYGGCLTVRKKWLEAVDGYDLHTAFDGGFHAHGRDVYTRLLNLGLSVKWHPNEYLYHAWHPGTGLHLSDRARMDWQYAIIRKRALSKQYKTYLGLSGRINPEATIADPPKGIPVDTLQGAGGISVTKGARKDVPFRKKVSIERPDANFIAKLINLKLDTWQTNLNGDPLTIFGCGQHTEWLFGKFGEHPFLKNRQLAFIDESNASAIYKGKPVYDLKSAGEVKMLLLSSDIHWKAMEEKAAKHFPNAAILNLYRDLPPGPYEKA